MENFVTSYMSNLISSPKEYLDKRVKQYEKQRIERERLLNKYIPVKKFKKDVLNISKKYIGRFRVAAENGRVGEFDDIYRDVIGDIKNVLTGYLLKIDVNDIKKVGWPFVMLLLSQLIMTIIIMTMIIAVFRIPPDRGIVMGTFITALIVAPVTEEFFKLYTMKSGYGPTALFLFNAFEFSQYVLLMIAQGISPIKAILVRLVTVIMHYTSAGTQKYFYDKDEEETGYRLSILIHSLFNFFAIFYAESIRDMIK